MKNLRIALLLGLLASVISIRPVDDQEKQIKEACRVESVQDYLRALHYSEFPLNQWVYPNATPACVHVTMEQLALQQRNQHTKEHEEAEQRVFEQLVNSKKHRSLTPKEKEHNNRSSLRYTALASRALQGNETAEELKNQTLANMKSSISLTPEEAESFKKDCLDTAALFYFGSRLDQLEWLKQGRFRTLIKQAVGNQCKNTLEIMHVRQKKEKPQRGLKGYSEELAGRELSEEKKQKQFNAPSTN